jgi:hypothetical protein
MEAGYWRAIFGGKKRMERVNRQYTDSYLSTYDQEEQIQ